MLLAGEVAHGVGEPELAALGDWLPEGRVDQKRLDALEMLAAMQAAPAAGEPASSAFHFEWTSLWDAFVARSEMSASAPSAKGQLILDELRLEGPEAYRQVEAKALMRMVAASGAARPKRGLARRRARGAQTAA